MKAPHPDCGIQSNGYDAFHADYELNNACPNGSQHLKNQSMWINGEGPCNPPNTTFKPNEPETVLSPEEMSCHYVTGKWCRYPTVYKSCRSESNPVELYDTCAHKKHGSKTCSHESFGPDQYFDCAQFTREEIEIFIAEVPATLDVMTMAMLRAEASVYATVLNQGMMFCSLRNLEALTANSETAALAFAELVMTYQTLFAIEYDPQAANSCDLAAQQIKQISAENYDCTEESITMLCQQIRLVEASRQWLRNTKAKAEAMLSDVVPQKDKDVKNRLASVMSQIIVE
jgi:hypothetical protein